MMMVFLLRKLKSQKRRKVRVRKGKGKKKRSVWKKRSPKASLYTQKGRDINEIPKIPLVQFTGYYILPSL